MSRLQEEGPGQSRSITSIKLKTSLVHVIDRINTLCAWGTVSCEERDFSNSMISKAALGTWAQGATEVSMVTVVNEKDKDLLKKGKLLNNDFQTFELRTVGGSFWSSRPAASCLTRHLEAKCSFQTFPCYSLFILFTSLQPYSGTAGSPKLGRHTHIAVQNWHPYFAEQRLRHIR